MFAHTKIQKFLRSFFQKATSLPAGAAFLFVNFFFAPLLAKKKWQTPSSCDNGMLLQEVSFNHSVLSLEGGGAREMNQRAKARRAPHACGRRITGGALLKKATPKGGKTFITG